MYVYVYIYKELMRNPWILGTGRFSRCKSLMFLWSQHNSRAQEWCQQFVKLWREGEMGGKRGRGKEKGKGKRKMEMGKGTGKKEREKDKKKGKGKRKRGGGKEKGKG